MNDNRGQRTEVGLVKIHKGAVANIAILAAGETPGVLGTSCGGVASGILKLFGMDKLDQGIKVELRENSAKINIGIVVEYGVNISEVANNVQENIKRQVENMVGFSLVEVDVDVQRIDTPKAP